MLGDVARCGASRSDMEGTWRLARVPPEGGRAGRAAAPDTQRGSSPIMTEHMAGPPGPEAHWERDGGGLCRSRTVHDGLQQVSRPPREGIRRVASIQLEGGGRDRTGNTACPRPTGRSTWRPRQSRERQQRGRGAPAAAWLYPTARPADAAAAGGRPDPVACNTSNGVRNAYTPGLAPPTESRNMVARSLECGGCGCTMVPAYSVPPLLQAHKLLLRMRARAGWPSVARCSYNPHARRLACRARRGTTHHPPTVPPPYTGAAAVVVRAPPPSLSRLAILHPTIHHPARHGTEAHPTSSMNRAAMTPSDSFRWAA